VCRLAPATLLRRVVNSVRLHKFPSLGGVSGGGELVCRLAPATLLRRVVNSVRLHKFPSLGGVSGGGELVCRLALAILLRRVINSVRLHKFPSLGGVPEGRGGRDGSAVQGVTIKSNHPVRRCLPPLRRRGIGVSASAGYFTKVSC